jgi:hypothetical protein
MYKSCLLLPRSASPPINLHSLPNLFGTKNVWFLFCCWHACPQLLPQMIIILACMAYVRRLFTDGIKSVIMMFIVSTVVEHWWRQVDRQTRVSCSIVSLIAAVCGSYDRRRRRPWRLIPSSWPWRLIPSSWCFFLLSDEFNLWSTHAQHRMESRIRSDAMHGWIIMSSTSSCTVRWGTRALLALTLRAPASNAHHQLGSIPHNQVWSVLLSLDSNSSTARPAQSFNPSIHSSLLFACRA